MKKVTILSVRIEGFGSYSLPTAFKFSNQGLYCIQGANGSGKSTIYSALVWGLYKLTLGNWAAKDIAPLAHLRTKDYRGTRVIVLMVVEGRRYMVARHLDYKATTLGVEGNSSLMIYAKEAGDKTAFTGEDMVGDALYKKDQQAYINKLLGVEANTFINSIVFGQKMNRLIGAEPKEKRELFEALFELEFIDTAKAKAELKKGELDLVITAIDTKTEQIKVALTAKEKQLESAAQTLAKAEEDKHERLDEIKEEYARSIAKYNALVDQLEELQTKQAKIKKLDKAPKVDMQTLANKAEVKRLAMEEVKEKIQAVKLSIQGVDQSIAAADREEVKLGEEFRNVADTCTMCGGKLDAAKVKTTKQNITKKIEAFDKQILNYRYHREQVAKSLTVLELELTDAKQVFDTAYHNWETAKNELKMSEDIYQPQIDRITAQMGVIDEGLETIKARRKREKARPLPEVDTKDIQNAIGLLNIQLETQTAKRIETNIELERVQWWIKKAFGANGLKSYIFSAMLQKLNEYVANYSMYFGYGVKFWIDLSKASKPFMTTVYSDKIEYPYANLSGGLRQRVDVCLAFAMFDLVEYKTKFNFMALDEAMEGLDQEGVDMVNSVLAEASQRKAIYIISHNPMFIPTSAATILVEGGIKTPSVITV